jgi:hypothetical protein
MLMDKYAAERIKDESIKRGEGWMWTGADVSRKPQGDSLDVQTEGLLRGFFKH